MTLKYQCTDPRNNGTCCQYIQTYLHKQGPPNTFFFGKCFKEKLLNIFSNFSFLFESTILPVNNGK